MKSDSRVFDIPESLESTFEIIEINGTIYFVLIRIRRFRIKCL